jgi:hypothetical protein
MDARGGPATASVVEAVSPPLDAVIVVVPPARAKARPICP